MFMALGQMQQLNMAFAKFPSKKKFAGI